MPTKPNQPFIPWSQRQLLPSEEQLRQQAACRLAEYGYVHLLAIAIPATTRVQWFVIDDYELTNVTPTIHALLYGKQLKSAPLYPGRADSWHRGLSLASRVNFRDPAVAKWWSRELALCARLAGIEMGVRVQVIRLDQAG